MVYSFFKHAITWAGIHSGSRCSTHGNRSSVVLTSRGRHKSRHLQAVVVRHASSACETRKKVPVTLLETLADCTCNCVARRDHVLEGRIQRGLQLRAQRDDFVKTRAAAPSHTRGTRHGETRHAAAAVYEAVSTRAWRKKVPVTLLETLTNFTLETALPMTCSSRRQQQQQAIGNGGGGGGGSSQQQAERGRGSRGGGGGRRVAHLHGLIDAILDDGVGYDHVAVLCGSRRRIMGEQENDTVGFNRAPAASFVPCSTAVCCLLFAAAAAYCCLLLLLLLFAAAAYCCMLPAAYCRQHTETARRGRRDVLRVSHVKCAERVYAVQRACSTAVCSV